MNNRFAPRHKVIDSKPKVGGRRIRIFRPKPAEPPPDRTVTETWPPRLDTRL